MIVTRPDGETRIVWSREMAWCSESGLPTRGRRPANTLRTSDRQRVPGQVADRVRRAGTRSLPRGRAAPATPRDRRVGRPDDHAPVPGNREQHAPVDGVRHHDGGVAGQERAVEHDVHALAGGDHGAWRRVVHPADLVREHAGGVDDDPGRGSRISWPDSRLRARHLDDPPTPSDLSSPVTRV